MLFVSRGGVGVAALAQPTREQPQRVIPERVDLHRLAAPRRHHPSVYLRVHPGELVAFFTLHEQPVRGIHMDVESRAAKVGVGNLD